MNRKAALCLLLSLPAAVFVLHKGEYREVSIPNKNISLCGTLMIPRSIGPFPR